MPACSCYTERTAGFPLWLCRLTLLPATRDGPPSLDLPSVWCCPDLYSGQSDPLSQVCRCLTMVFIYLPWGLLMDILCVFFLTSVYFPINSLFMSFAHFQVEFCLVCFLKFVNDLRKTRIYCPPPHALIGQLLCAPQPVIGPEPLVHLDPLPPTEPPAGAISFPY